MIDTHCHLTDPRLSAQLPAVLERAQAAGVTHMITIGTDVEDSRQSVELCRRYPERLRCTVGIHPGYLRDGDVDAASLRRDMEAIKLLQAAEPVVAIGEIGLDYHYYPDPAIRALQRQVFRLQLEVAVECGGRAVVIHCREATDDCLAILRDFASLPAVFHCFTGSVAEAERILAAGYLLGFTGVVTFKRSDELREVVRRTPLDRLLLETDAPYLSPEPMRKQKVNEPALVIHTARAIAELKGTSPESLDQATQANAARLFRWPA